MPCLFLYTQAINISYCINIFRKLKYLTAVVNFSHRGVKIFSDIFEVYVEIYHCSVPFVGSCPYTLFSSYTEPGDDDRTSKVYIFPVTYPDNQDRQCIVFN